MDWAQRTGAGRWALGVGDGAGSVQTWVGSGEPNRFRRTEPVQKGVYKGCEGRNPSFSHCLSLSSLSYQQKLSSLSVFSNGRWGGGAAAGRRRRRRRRC